MPVSRIDLLNHALPRAFRGYSVAETDRFLQDVADTLGRLNDEKTALISRIAVLEQQIVEYKERESALQSTLVAAQRMAGDIRNASQKEAQLLLDAARAKADSLINQGNARLARILEDISDARKLKARFEVKLRSVIESHAKLLDMEREEEARLEAGGVGPDRSAGGGGGE